MPEFAQRLSEAHPDTIAIRDPSAALTWAEVDDVLNRVANTLAAVDLGPAHRIAVFAENAVETALAHLGGLLGSASSVPVNFHLTAAETNYILNDSQARVLFAGPATVDRAMEAAADSAVEQIVVWGDRVPAGATGWAEWLAAGDSAQCSGSLQPRPNLLYTSGTTGLPKGTELPPTMFAGGDTVDEHLANLATSSGFTAFGTHLVVGPMYHTGPLSGMRLLVAGISSVILAKFDAEATLRAIDEFKTETSVMVPTHFARLLALPTEVKQRYDVSSMKYVAHTGAKCPVDVKRAMIEWWGPIFRDAYGASEVGTTCAITSEEWLERPGSVGKAIGQFSALVLDDDNNELPANTEGRLFFRDATGRGVVYPNDPEKTAAAHVAPGVFTLGEIGYVDDDGYVYITDRFSDMVVSGGVNIYPAEAEQVLTEHPEVVDVACIGVPNADMGEELKALVIPADPTSPPNAQALIDYCRERLSTYKCPRSVELVDTIGRTTMGKVNKRKLRAPYWP
jgi:acyl-CoA synthetase (AMP-forming)/AMP-acid ligase II